MLRAGFLLLMVGCVSMGSTPPKTVDRIERRSASPRPEPKAKGPSALTEAPGEGERPELIDSSLAIELDNGRGGATVRVGVAFALHGLFAVDDAIRLRLMNSRGRALGKPVRCPQRASRRSGTRVTCRAKVDQRAGELPVRKGTYRFRIEHLRDNKPHLLRKGRFSVFPCSFGLCLDKDYKTGEHWAEFEGRRLTFRLTLKRRSDALALHANPKRQAKAKPPFPIETVSTKCQRGKEQVGKVSESFEVLEDDGVWTTLRARSGAGVKHLTRIGSGRLVCQVRINGRDRVTLTMRVDDQGSLALHKLQKSAKNPIRSPWFWVDARRPKRLDANARVRRSVQRARLFGKR